MPGKYLGFGHERLNTEKVSEKAEFITRAKTSVDKNPSNTVTGVLNVNRPFKVLSSVVMRLQR